MRQIAVRARWAAVHSAVWSGLRLLALLALAQGVGLTLGSGRAKGGERVLWQIGKADDASLEFNDHWNFAQGHDPTFVVGKSSPDKDWSGTQPSTSGGPGAPAHPFTVIFQLDAVPRGVFYLTVDAMFRSPLIPNYLIDVNGRKGMFHFHPALTYDTGDPETAWNIMFSVQRLKVALPGTYFRQGENRIIFTCTGDASEAILPATNERTSASSIYYDDLQLSQDPDAKSGRLPPVVTARPTIFYSQHGGGPLSEIIVLEVSSHSRFEHGTASLRVEEQHYSCALASPYDFGEAECSVEVPELRGETAAKLTVTLAGKSSSSSIQLVPQKKWKLYLTPQMHLDMGYTEYRPASYEVHDRNIDEIIGVMESHPGYKFNPDGSFIFEDFWKHRDDYWKERCLKLLGEGRLTLPAQLFSVNSGLASQEELNRLVYFSASFGREHHIPVEYANQTDVPAHSWALPSILADVGVKYLAISSNPWRGPIILHGRLNEESPFWWEGPDGGKVLTWYSRQYAHLAQLFTRQPTPRAGVDSLPIFLQAYSAPSYAADAVMLYGTQSDNAPFASEDVGFPDRWNTEFAYPKIVVSTMVDFFRYMEGNFAGSFSTLRGDGGAWWEEMAASDAFYAGASRKTKQRVLAAEAAASLGAIVNKDFSFPLGQDREIWHNLLMYTEHTWGTPRAWLSPASDPARVLLRDKESFTQRAEIETDHMLRRGLSQLADRIRTSGDTVVVFNPLSWQRGGLVEVELPRGGGLVDARDSQPVPLELLRRVKEEEYDRVRFWADAVPALGYRSYMITPSGSAETAIDQPLGDAVENEFYRVRTEASRGGIESIFDKQLNKELIDRASPYAFGQYLYAGYGHPGASLIEQRSRFNTSLLQYSTALPLPNLEVSPAQGRIVARQKTPWGAVLILESSASHTPLIETEIRLFDRQKRIELINTVHKEEVQAPEGVYFAFPFSAQQPTVRYEIQDAWVDPMQDQLPGANKEWFSAQHWVSVTNPEFSAGLTLDEAPLFTLGDINRGKWPTNLDLQNGTVFSYIMNNYDGDDERPFQGGAFTFHYALSSTGQFDPSSWARFSREATNALEIQKVTRADKRDAPPEPLDLAENSFIAVDPAEILLTAWKAAEDGDGYILRFYNTTERAVTGSVRFPRFQFRKVYRTNAVEANRKALDVTQGRITLSLKPHEIYSVRIVDLRLR